MSSFYGLFPYGTDGGPDDTSDTNGNQIAAGTGEGADWFLITDDQFTIRSLTSITEIVRVLAAGGSGAIPISGGGVATIILDKNGAIIDAGMTTLNFGNEFGVTSAPAGQGNVSLGYAGSAGLFGTAVSPARSDHTHPAHYGAVYTTKSYDGRITQVSISGTTIATVSQYTVNSAAVLLNGVTYDCLIWGGVEALAPGSGYIFVCAHCNGSFGAQIGEGTVGESRTLFVSMAITIVGTGAAVSFGLASRVDVGSGELRSGSAVFVATPRI